MRSLFLDSSGAHWRAALWFLATFFIGSAHAAPAGAAGDGRRGLTLEERVAYQRAIEAVDWQYRIWPKENPQPKPALEVVMPMAAIRAKVADDLRKSQALAAIWRRPITGAQLQREMERMARQTQQPERLAALWAALGNDPYVIAECLARPSLANRLIRTWYAGDEPFAAWWQTTAPEIPMEHRPMGDRYRLPEIGAGGVECQDDTWRPTAGPPDPRTAHTAVWTGTEMIVWGGNLSPNRSNTGGRYDPATDTWAATSLDGAPSARSSHTAVWTGTEMIVWGGGFPFTITGGRYDPATDTWMATSVVGAPSARSSYTAVWTGTEMIVWGGGTSTGGRYYARTPSP